MSSLFADTHNVFAILEKSDAAEGFEKIIDFLSGSYIHYVLTVSPHIYISCIKQFWNSISVKRSGDVTRLQALVDKKNIVISEGVIREILQLNDAEGVVCLPNEEIFAGLAQMGYEKPSTKLTFYKAFFFSQWKFLIHTILQSLSAKRTSWNEFSTSMASVVICLSKGFSWVETPLFEGMIADRQPAEEELGAEQVQVDAAVAAAVINSVAEDVAHVDTPLPPLHGISSPPHEPSLPPQQPHVTPPRLEIVKLKARVKKLKKTDKVKSSKFRRLRKEDVSEVLEVVEVVTTAKLITEVVTAAASQVSAVSTTIPAASATIPAAKPSIPAAAPTVVASYTRRRKGVIIRDPEEELSLKTSAETPAETPKVKDKGKGILVKAPNPMKKKDQIEMDEEYARKLQEEIDRDHDGINKDVDWDAAMDHVNQKSSTLVKRWKLLTSCGVHVITLSTVQLYLLVERRYLLSRFTLEQLVNVTRLQVEEESEMSLELLRVNAAK
nr:hypothetical protein [Tanacetum cinerariifolium]